MASQIISFKSIMQDLQVRGERVTTGAPASLPLNFSQAAVIHVDQRFRRLELGTLLKDRDDQRRCMIIITANHHVLMQQTP